MTRHTTIRILLALLAVPAFAQETKTPEEWVAEIKAEARDELTSSRHYLSGRGTDDAIPWEFKLERAQTSTRSGPLRGAGVWSTIPVPSSWEHHGFGVYSNDKRQLETDEVGHYRHRFMVPDTWRGRHVQLMFEGVLTDAAVSINGERAGAVHQGGYYCFSYDVTGLLRYGEENLLEVLVHRKSRDSSVVAAESSHEFWMCGGIYRPVSLVISPPAHIARVAIDARSDGSLRGRAFCVGASGQHRVRVQAIDEAGAVVVGSLSTPAQIDDGSAEWQVNCPEIRSWNAECPVLYTLHVELLDGERVVHRHKERFGFRSIEVREKHGLFINNSRVFIKGTSRHSLYPNTGRATNRDLSRSDIELMKAMNMNAVRAGHYPPDKHFLELCDEMGLYVMVELVGFTGTYVNKTGKRLADEMMYFLGNHPSLVFWANGNEGWHKKRLSQHIFENDLQERPVVHPGEGGYGNCLRTPHYKDYPTTRKCLLDDQAVLSTEMNHALYMGGGGAGLASLWELFRQSQAGVGLLVWEFMDQGVVRADRDGLMDTRGFQLCDGILGPYREKDGSFSAIREIWTPVEIVLPTSLPDEFQGKTAIRNHYDFITTDGHELEWQLSRFLIDDTAAKETEPQRLPLPILEPGGESSIALKLPEDWRHYDSLHMRIFDRDKRVISERSWRTRSSQSIARDIVGADQSGTAPIVAKDASTITITHSAGHVVFDHKTGRLMQLVHDNTIMGLYGPIDLHAEQVETVTHSVSDGIAKLHVQYGPASDLTSVEWQVRNDGWLLCHVAGRLTKPGYAPGIHFGLEPAQIGCRRSGRGPHRIWKNRVHGPTHGVWTDSFHDGVAGKSWRFPAYQGFFDDVSWVQIATQDGRLQFIMAKDGIIFRNGNPRNARDAKKAVYKPLPGDLSILAGSTPIGDKFHRLGHAPTTEPYPAGFAFDVSFYLRFDDGQVLGID